MNSCNNQMLTGVALLAGAVSGPAAGLGKADARRPNVLFIVADDLRPELACYGASHIHSPRIDRLAASGTRFDRAYCQLPICGPSRASMMTGLRGTPDRFTGRTCRADVDVPRVVPMNTHFKQHGYYTISNGKIFDQIKDSEAGWSEDTWRPRGGRRFFDCYVLPESLEIETWHKSQPVKTRGVHRGPPYEAADVPDNAYTDGMMAERAIEDLRRMAEKEQPFFMAVGFPRPHLPFVAPKKYWDLYNFDDIRLPSNYRLPEGAPVAADRDWNELRLYAGIPKEGPVPDETARRLIHGYYACVSYVDALIGQILDELRNLGLEENTIVVFWGDHGFHLGEQSLWCKYATFEVSMRVPLIIRAPGLPENMEDRSLVDSIDIYPTLCELAGLPLPEHSLEGRSLVPLMRGESRDGHKREAAFGRLYAAETIRTDRYRYTEYYHRTNGDLQGRMLYDHEADPDETVNQAENPEAEVLVAKLSARLHVALPDGHPLRIEGTGLSRNAGENENDE